MCIRDRVKIAYSASMDEFSVACGYRTMKITDEFLVKGYYRNYDGMHLLKHALRSEEHTSELQSLREISYAVFCFFVDTFDFILDAVEVYKRQS